MYIQRAIRISMKCGGRIARPCFCEYLQIEPTNSDEGFILHGIGQAPCPRWQPSAEDLLAGDWEITTEVWT